MRTFLSTSLLLIISVVSAGAETSPASVLAIAIDPGNAQDIYAASPGGLYISHNGGMGWARAVGLPAGPVPNVVVAPFRPGAVYAIADNHVFKSTDRGTTWSPTGQPAGPVLVADPHEDSILYAGGVSGGPNLAKSFDGGSTWISVAIVDTDAQQPGFTVTTTISRLLIDSRAPDVLYAVARTTATDGVVTNTYDKVFKSFTGGAYWQAIPIGGTNLAISPHTSELYFTVNDFVYVSADGGATAAPSFVTYIGANADPTPRAIGFNPLDAAALYVSSHGTWFIRTPGSASFWSTGSPARTAGLDVLATDPAAANVIYAGSSCGWPGQQVRACVPLVKSFDGGRTWRDITHGYREPELVLLATGPFTPLAITAVTIETVGGRPSYRVSQSGDGGLTWTRKGAIRTLTEGLAGPDGVRLVVTDQQTLAAALPNELLVSVDGGNVFTSIFSTSFYNPLPASVSLMPSRSETFWAAFDAPGQGTKLYEYASGVWRDMGGLVWMRPTGLYVFSPDSFFVTGFYDSTGDQIQSRENLFWPLPFTPNQPIRGMAFGSSIFAATGTPGARDGRVFESLDRGLTWTRVGPADVLFDITDIETLTAPVYLSSDLYLADAERGVFVYRRASNTWESLGYAGATMMTAAAGSTHMLYAGTPSGAVWRVEPRPFADMRLNAASAAAGLPITFGGTGAGGITPREYRFRRYDPAAGWLLVRDYAASATYTWTPTDVDGGSHLIEIAVRAIGAAEPELVDYAEFHVAPRRDRVVTIPFRHDGDAYRDIFVYDRVTGLWSIRHGNALGQFAAGPSGGWAAGWDISVADFNADGLDDFFLYSSASGNWYKAINAGAGFTYFTQGWSQGLDILPLDLNGDNRADIFTHNPRTGLGFACTSLGDGTGGFNCTPSQWAPGFRAFAADFNADGRGDLFIHRSIGGEYYKLISQGDGTFAYVGSAWAPHWTPTILDLNGDGRSDVFLYDRTTGVSYRAVSTGDGTAGFSHAVEQWRHGWDVYAADFDLDGRDDLFLYDGGSWEKVLNDGTAFEHFAGGWARWTITVTDLNGDGRADVFLFDPASGQWYQALTTTPDAFAYTSGAFW